MAIILGSILLLAVQVRSQVTEGKKDAFATIPAAEQPKLFERLRLFVAAQSERRWNDLYDLSFAAFDGSITRAAFVKEHENGFPGRNTFELLAFAPTVATVVNMNADGKEWLVEGCAKYREKRKSYYRMAGLNAKLNRGQWYFTYLSELTSGADGPPLPCTHKAKTHLSKYRWRRGS
jgi:hypothetical protein